MNIIDSYHQAQFAIDSDERSYTGFTQGNTWNGWACPSFTKAEADRMLLEFGLGEYSAKDDAYIYNLSESTDPEDWDVFEGMDILVNGEQIHVYPVGAGCWVWDELEEESIEKA